MCFFVLFFLVWFLVVVVWLFFFLGVFFLLLLHQVFECSKKEASFLNSTPLSQQLEHQGVQSLFHPLCKTHSERASSLKARGSCSAIDTRPKLFLPSARICHFGLQVRFTKE